MEILKSNGLYYEFPLESLTWYTSIQYQEESSGEKIAYSNYKYCYMRNCITYMDNKIYLCPLVAYLERNKQDKSAIMAEGIINLEENVKENPKIIENFLTKYSCGICGHCDLDVKKTKTAEQL